MHFTGFKDDSRSRSVGELAGLSHQGIELVDGEEVTEGVDGHVAIDTRCGEPVEVGCILSSIPGV